MFAGTLLGMSFSFSLVNLLDPNTQVETPVLGQMLGWLGVLVIVGAGLDRVLLAAVVRSFCAVSVGHAVVQAATGAALAKMAGGIFLAGLQLAAPVMAAALVVEMTVSMVSRLAPMLPVQVVGVPLKTMASYVVLIGSLAVWPGWIERHFTGVCWMRREGCWWCGHERERNGGRERSNTRRRLAKKATACAAASC